MAMSKRSFSANRKNKRGMCPHNKSLSIETNGIPKKRDIITMLKLWLPPRYSCFSLSHCSPHGILHQQLHSKKWMLANIFTKYICQNISSDAICQARPNRAKKKLQFCAVATTPPQRTEQLDPSGGSWHNISLKGQVGPR